MSRVVDTVMVDTVVMVDAVVLDTMVVVGAGKELGGGWVGGSVEEVEGVEGW